MRLPSPVLAHSRRYRGWIDSSTHYHPFSQELRSRTEALPERPPGLWIRRTPTCVMALAVVIAHEELIIVALVS